MVKIIDTLGTSRAVCVVGAGPPLLLLHGFTGSMATWYPFISKWARRYQVIAVDIVGHGQTKSPNDVDYYTMEHEAAALIECLNVINVKKANILGYSMGGRLALYMKVKYPDRVGQLLLESSSPGLLLEKERHDRQISDNDLADQIVSKGVTAFINQWEKLPLFATQKSLPIETKRLIRKERLSQTSEGLANSLRGMGTGIQPSLWDALKGTVDSADIIVGNLDHKFVEIGKLMIREIPQAKLNVITHAGHAIHVEQPGIFDRMVYDGFYQTILERND